MTFTGCGPLDSPLGPEDEDDDDDPQLHPNATTLAASTQRMPDRTCGSRNCQRSSTIVTLSRHRASLNGCLADGTTVRMKRVVLALAIVAAGCSKKGGEGRQEPAKDIGLGSGRNKGDPTTGMPGGGRGIEVLLDGDFEAVGAIDKGTVRQVVKENVTKLQACYEQTLMANPNIAGTVTATFTVDNGSVTNIKANGVHPDVEQCVIKAVQAFKFPPGGKVDVSYPFTFKPAS